MTDDTLTRILARKRWERDVLRDAVRGHLRVPPDAPFLPAPDVLRRAKGYLKQGGCGPDRGPGFKGDEGAPGGPIRPFAAALTSETELRVVAEIKRRSPSRGALAAWTDPEPLAQAYAEGQAAAISCLTDAEFFDGRPGFLPRVRAVFAGPVLRKDFTIDVIDVAVAAALGADALLLIVAALGPDTGRLLREARAFAIEALVEVHDARELDLAMISGAAVVGINNRDLRTFAVDLETTERLAVQVPPWAALVGESGIQGPKDAARMRKAGCDAILVGESLAATRSAAAPKPAALPIAVSPSKAAARAASRAAAEAAEAAAEAAEGAEAADGAGTATESESESADPGAWAASRSGQPRQTTIAERVAALRVRAERRGR